MTRPSFPAAVCALAIIALIVAAAAVVPPARAQAPAGADDCDNVASVPPARAQDGITVSRQGVENRFPEGLRFYIDAASADSPISEIRVYVCKFGQSSRSVYRAVAFEPGPTISGEATFKSQTANEYIPTGTRLSYYFDIRADDGTTLKTEPEIIVYLNRGLDWQSVASGLIRVYYYRHSDRSESRANAVLDIAAATYTLMQPILGVELAKPMHIVVYSDYADMQDALPPTSSVAARQLRTLGQAYANERTLLVDGSNDLFTGDNTLTTAAHEFTHLLVADAAGKAHHRVPTWLNEGLAVYSEQNPHSEFGYYLDEAIQNDAVPPLAGLRTFAGTPRETLLNYGLGHAVVSYMLDTYGASKMAALFADISTTTTPNLEKSLVATYGLTIHELDNRWRQSVGLAPRSQDAPALPPLQVLPTRRPTPTAPSAAPAPPAMSTAPAPAARPAESPAPATHLATTYTPQPAPTRASAPTPSPSPTAPTGGGCTAPAPTRSARALPAELAAIALLAVPAGLTLAALRRRRR